jgi:hypothetical protein
MKETQLPVSYLYFIGTVLEALQGGPQYYICFIKGPVKFAP